MIIVYVCRLTSPPLAEASAGPKRRKTLKFQRDRRACRSRRRQKQYRVVQKSWCQVARKLESSYSQPKTTKPG